jgi:hypothetical protein
MKISSVVVGQTLQTEDKSSLLQQFQEMAKKFNSHLVHNYRYLTVLLLICQKRIPTAAV